MQAKMEGMLFDNYTTYRTDYQKYDSKAPVLTTFKTKSTCAMRRPPPLKDVHTMSDWKTAAIPFNLIHKPRDIVGTNPWMVQKHYEKPPDLGREEAQKSRPRLVMTPAVSMDDIENPVARKILCEDMYVSDMTRGLREAVSPYFRVQAPFPGLPAPANPITLRKYQLPVVPPEWRMESVSWDLNQLRAYTDATKEFWLQQKIPKCRACEETAVIGAQRKCKK